MSAAIAAGAARRGAEKRKEMAAERKAEEKCVADATKALKKLKAATTLDELSDALRRGTRLKSYLPELKKAIPEAEKRLKEMTANAEKGDIDEFMARVEAAAKRDGAGASSMDLLEGYFKDLVSDAAPSTHTHTRTRTRAVARTHTHVHLTRTRTRARARTRTRTRTRGTKSWSVLPTQRRPPHAQFSDFNEDGDNCLNFAEFKQALEIIAPSFGEAELKGAFRAADTDGSGGVDKEEFMKRVSMFQKMSEDMDNAETDSVTIAAGVAASVHTEKNLMQLTAEEKKEAEMLFQKYDKDKSGELDFAEFRKVRRARSPWLGAAGGVRVCGMRGLAASPLYARPASPEAVTGCTRSGSRSAGDEDSRGRGPERR